MKFSKLLVSASVMAFLCSCGSTQNTQVSEPSVNLPEWVLNPVLEDGLAAVDCVKYSGNLSVDQKMATANSRLALAQQIETRVEGLDKTYLNRVDSNEDVTTGTNFSSVSKQITNQKLTGSRVIKTGIFEIAKKQHFCVMTSISPAVTNDLFSEIIAASKKQINPQDEKFLYQEFKAQKAEVDLDKEISRLTN